MNAALLDALGRIEELLRYPLHVVQSVPFQACPVCGGAGTLDQHFYSRLPVATSTSRIECKTCKGSGLISTSTGRPPNA